MGGKSISEDHEPEVSKDEVTFLSHSLAKGEEAFESCHIKGHL